MRDPGEQYEANAEAFYRETRIMAPGKDIPAAMGGYDEHELRAKLWRVWLENQRMADRIRELEGDAKRYQWLRERLHSADFDYGGSDWVNGIAVLTFKIPETLSVSADLDATLDAAMTPEVSNG